MGTPGYLDEEIAMPKLGINQHTEKADNFYDVHYDVLLNLWLRPDTKLVFGNKDQTCRFCRQSAPKVTFKNKAHAIPESLGNRSVFTSYECDTCNKFFGDGIENDFGNWTKPNRTFSRIRGKKGVPTIKEVGPGKGFRIEHDRDGFHVKQYEEDAVVFLDEEAKQVRFELKRDTHTPVAVLKAFVRIGLTLLPDEELPNFSDILQWIRESDHTKSSWKELPVISIFQPGPMPNDLIVVMLLRRKPLITGVPYAFLILGYGNDVFQVFLPSRQHDKDMKGNSVTLPVFPTPGGPDPVKYGKPRSRILDLTGRNVVKDDIVRVVLGFEQAIVEPTKKPLDA